MCYDIQARLETQRKRYRYWNDAETIKNIEEILEREQLDDFYHVSGFQHPKIIAYTNDVAPIAPQWGLIPAWVKSVDQANKIANSTSNARGESIFEKPAFVEAAYSKRCLIYVDGFFEHYHYKKQAYPFFIRLKDQSPMILAGVWAIWKNPDNGEKIKSFSVVTTKANSMLEKIHNADPSNPRMPVILSQDRAEMWLSKINNSSDKQMIIDLITPFNPDLMESFSVRKIRGKSALGNVPGATQKFIYPELV